jgi:tripartite-type tricarboxylate transporter receptor subunit TctC
MQLQRFAAWPFMLAATIFVAEGALGQSYPSKSIRIITAEAGGGVDFTTRLITQGLSVNLEQPVVIYNRGGSAIIPALAVAKAAPDGYTLLFYGPGFWLMPFLQDNVPYDPLKDFVPITLATMSPNILVVHPSLPVRSVKELIALAKSRPGEINYASGPPGGSIHLTAELFKSMAGVDIVPVPYKGNAPGLNALVGGHVQLMFPTAGSVTQLVNSGRLKALAVTSAERSTVLPGMPTVAEAGVPGFEAVAIYGAFAPARTPAPVISRLNQEIVRVLNNADVKKRLLDAGVEVVGSTPEQLSAKVKGEMTRIGKEIKSAGIRTQ